MNTNLPQYFQLPNYRKIVASFEGFRSDGSGPFVKFTDDYVGTGDRVKTKMILLENEEGENLENFALGKLRNAGFEVVGRSTGQSGYSFLCNNWGDTFAEIKNIK